MDSLERSNKGWEAAESEVAKSARKMRLQQEVIERLEGQLRDKTKAYTLEEAYLEEAYLEEELNQYRGEVARARRIISRYKGGDEAYPGSH